MKAEGKKIETREAKKTERKRMGSYFFSPPPPLMMKDREK
jgi:hypothetical protein